MKGAFSALAALLFLSSCETASRPVSVLQRFDRMKRDLRWLTTASDRVSVDAGGLATVMRGPDVAGIQAASVRLKRDASVFSRRAGAAGNTTRALTAEATPGAVRVYLREVTSMLGEEWTEGVALAVVANLAWHDPLSVRGDDARRLERNVLWARLAASRAVAATAAARAIRDSHRSQFRYEISTPTT